MYETLDKHMYTDSCAALSGFASQGRQSRMQAAGKEAPADECAVPLKSEAMAKPFLRTRVLQAVSKYLSTFLGFDSHNSQAEILGPNP